jgi:hypothetical protein
MLLVVGTSPTVDSSEESNPLLRVADVYRTGLVHLLRNRGWLKSLRAEALFGSYGVVDVVHASNY